MNGEDIKTYFKEIFAQVAPEVTFEKIDMNMPLREQIEIDSLDFYKIVVALQKKTNVYISDSQLANFKSLNELIKFILSQSPQDLPLNLSSSGK
ncbi:MAG: acyl carrier protein [Bacteriovorax sp.]|nr:acyl carrier protein [Bacteriovorax sp.]